MSAELAAAKACLNAAVENVKSAQAELKELERQVTDQRHAIGPLLTAMRDAQLDVDKLLPQAVIVIRDWYSSKSTRIPAVIVKRTDKSITARRHGGVDSSAQQYRRSKFYAGRWTEYPRNNGFHSICELELPEGNSE